MTAAVDPAGPSALFLIVVGVAGFLWWAIVRRNARTDRTVSNLRSVEGTVVALTISTEGRLVLFGEMSGRLVSVNRTGIDIEPFEPVPTGIVGPAPRRGGTMHVPFRLISSVETVRGHLVLRDHWSVE